MNSLSLKKLRNSELRDRLSSGIRGMRLSYPETVFLVTAVIFAIGVVSYFLVKVPARRFQVRDLVQREEIANTALARQRKKEDQLGVQRENADRILASLHDFESRLDDSFGKTRIIDEVNRLAKVNRVVASDFNYRFADAAEQTGEQTQPHTAADSATRSSELLPGARNRYHGGRRICRLAPVYFGPRDQPPVRCHQITGFSGDGRANPQLRTPRRCSGAGDSAARSTAGGARSTTRSTAWWFGQATDGTRGDWRKSGFVED